MIERLIRFCMEQKLLVLLSIGALLVWGLLVAPFDFQLGNLPRDPVAVDAIPDLGENQQIVFTEWPGRSPQDVEDQITYPLTVAMLGVPGVTSIRSNSMFGFSTISVIFDEKVEFYWSRSRILERLNSLPAGTLPPNVEPALGPDATAMGQIFWYTLEGRDENGRPVGGWDLDELRSIQDWYVRPGLQSAEGVAEVAGVGGYIREYQIDIDPDALRAFELSLADVARAIRNANLDVGARTLEQSGVEYVVRGRGFIQNVEDIEQTAVAARDGTPITIAQLGTVGLGPAERRGALDKGGSDAVGGVVVARFGANPMQVIQNVKAKIDEVSPGLPRRQLEDGRTSQVTIVPFYDRTGLIEETLGTLQSALGNQILVTLLVIVLMVFHLRCSILVGLMLPFTVLLTFILMKIYNVQANVVALAGIAIAIGAVVDMGIVLSENMLKRLDELAPGERTFEALVKAAGEVGGAVLTAVATTVVSFLPVFTMTGAEGKLFTPLAFTKTFALIASIFLSLILLPPLAHVLFGARKREWPTLFRRTRAVTHPVMIVSLGALLAILLAYVWEPLGALESRLANLLFVVIVAGGLIVSFWGLQAVYTRGLGLCLRFKVVFLSLPVLIVFLGLSVWLGFPRVFGWLPESVQKSPFGETMASSFPGLGREFMPTLDEGSFLYMPVTMPHASIGEALEYMRITDLAMQSIPEVETVVGKIGRVDSALDPAPLAMIETVIQYVPEYRQDSRGWRLNFAYDEDTGEYLRDEEGELIPDPRGRPYRQWRPHIHTPDDIWSEIVAVTQVPGLTSAPKLAPIAARLVMLQTGMRAPMGVKVRGPDLETIQEVAYRVEELLKEVDGVRPSAVIAERIVGKPYLEIVPDRREIARYGIAIQDVMDTIEVALGGVPLTRTVEGRERYPVRVRYARELRDTIEELGNILVSSEGMRGGAPVQIPLREVAEIEFRRGPDSIRTEDTFLVAYVLFDRMAGFAEVDVVENAREVFRTHLNPDLPAGVSYSFAGAYEHQLRAARTLSIVLPLALLIIFLILYLQFRSVAVTMVIFSAIAVAWAGGFIGIWLWSQPWFLNFPVGGINLRELFQMGPINLSVAVWVGFLALFGIATDDGVIMATYIRQSLAANPTATVEDLRKAIIEAGARRIRPCLMTSATTILALLPVLTSVGKGSEIMIPMAIPTVGGMIAVLISVFAVPTLYCMMEEYRLAAAARGKERAS